MRTIWMAFAALPFVAACAETQTPARAYDSQPAAPTFNAGQASLRLRVGMTEQEAINAIGWQPTSAEQSTRGAGLGKPWNCRVLTFGSNFGNVLTIHQASFRETIKNIALDQKVALEAQRIAALPKAESAATSVGQIPAPWRR